jgi:hypothetical protein
MPSTSSMKVLFSTVRFSDASAFAVDPPVPTTGDGIGDDVTAPIETPRESTRYGEQPPSRASRPLPTIR